LIYFSFFGPLPRDTPDKAILVRSHHLARITYSGQPLRADSIAIDQMNILNDKPCQELLITEFSRTPNRHSLALGQNCLKSEHPYASRTIDCRQDRE